MTPRLPKHLNRMCVLADGRVPFYSGVELSEKTRSALLTLYKRNSFCSSELLQYYAELVKPKVF